MSVKLVEQETRRFLQGELPEVACITSRWGVGKTYAWQEILKDAKAEERIALQRYAYVSLFGVTTMDELKSSIFTNTMRFLLVISHTESYGVSDGGRISALARDALVRIGRESPFNASRVEKYGIDINDPRTPPAAENETA